MLAYNSGEHVCHPSFSQLQQYFHYEIMDCSYNALLCSVMTDITP